MVLFGRRTNTDLRLRAWSQLINQQGNAAVNLTVGLLSGSRLDIDRRAVDRLAIAATVESGLSTLLIRLSVCGTSVSVLDGSFNLHTHEKPVPNRSPLGQWSEIELEMRLGGSAPLALELLPKWLAKWKREYRLILIDLGPMHHVPCRTVGRYCDTCYLVLGPYSCASYAWIMQQIALLTQCDVALAGSLIAESLDAVAA